MKQDCVMTLKVGHWHWQSSLVLRRSFYY